MILYFSGTGNSEYIARRIAKATGDEILSLNERIRNGNAAAVRTERLVFVTPTYGWRIPRLVEKWIDETEFYGDELSAWFIMSCGSEIGNAAKYNARLCERKGFAYMGTEQVIMPENYVAMFAVPERDEAIKIVAARTGQIADAAERIANGEPFTAEPVKLIDRIYSDIVNPLFYKCFVKDSKFYVKDSCISCGKCARECPTHSISIENGRPVWGGHCTHCMACICDCPAAAIEYGKASIGKPRYHCPVQAE